MAARQRIGLSENTRKRIQTTMLVKRLQKHVLGEVKLSSSQVKAIEVLLKKTLPDFSPVALTEYLDRVEKENKVSKGKESTVIKFEVSNPKGNVTITNGPDS